MKKINDYYDYYNPNTNELDDIAILEAISNAKEMYDDGAILEAASILQNVVNAITSFDPEC